MNQLILFNMHIAYAPPDTRLARAAAVKHTALAALAAHDDQTNISPTD